MKKHFPGTRLLLCGLAVVMVPQWGRAFKVYGPPVSYRPVHENITREGLGFLKPEFYEAVVYGNNYTDVVISNVQDHEYWHFDDCAFNSTAGQINARYTAMLNYYNSWYSTSGRQNSDLYWTGTTDDDNHFCMTFGFIMHAVQDFYSHSNWIELRTQGFVTETLYDAGLGPWWRASGYFQPHPVQPNLIVAEGNTSECTAAGWTASFLQGPDTSPAGKTMKLTSNTGGGIKYGLVTGKYHAGTHVHGSVWWGHNDDDGPVSGTNRGLNKDVAGRLYFDHAAQLAVLQTAHEWDRLVALLRAQPNGNAKAAALEQAAVNYKTQIYVDGTNWKASNQYGYAGEPVAGIPDQYPAAFEVPSGTSGVPYRFVPVAVKAAHPGGATVSITASTYPGNARIGKTGQPLRLQKSTGTGNVRLTK